jgi:hypothetical protein
MKNEESDEIPFWKKPGFLIGAAVVLIVVLVILFGGGGEYIYGKTFEIDEISIVMPTKTVGTANFNTDHYLNMRQIQIEIDNKRLEFNDLDVAFGDNCSVSPDYSVDKGFDGKSTTFFHGCKSYGDVLNIKLKVPGNITKFGIVNRPDAPWRILGAKIHFKFKGEILKTLVCGTIAQDQLMAILYRNDY